MWCGVCVFMCSYDYYFYYFYYYVYDVPYEMSVNDFCVYNYDVPS